MSVTDESNDDQLEMFDELEATIRNVWCEVMAMVGSDKIEVVTWDMLYEETQNDPSMVQLIEMIHRSFPDRTFDMPDTLKLF